MAEAAVVAAVRRVVLARGGWIVNVLPSGETGIPDLLACYRGHFIAIETKHPRGGTVRAKQAFHLERIRRAGGIAIVVRDTQNVVDVLDGIDIGTAGFDA